MQFNQILAHAPFLGFTGYANHARNFFTHLNKFIPTRVRNFTHTSNIDYLTQEQKDMVIHQTWGEPPWEIGNPYLKSNKNKIINIVLMETNHMYFYDAYEGPKIAYNVWESTRQPDEFFNKLKEFDQIWVPTEWQKTCTIEQGIEENRVFVVPEGVDTERFYPIEPEYSDKFRFMIFGRWDYRKYTREMVQAFIETFDKNENVELILSVDNPFPVDGYSSTEERLEKYGLQDERIKILHFPSDEEYVRYLQNGHVMLSASRSEGWGLPAHEALACGTPTIITNWGAPLEYGEAAYKVNIKGIRKPENVFMQNDTPGFWAEPDFEHLKETMRYVYENYEECKKQTIDNIEIARSFTWENATNKALEILENFDIKKFYPVKLNIGSGPYLKDGYVNIDKYVKEADQIADALHLPYENNSVNEVYSSHFLEHINKYEISNALTEWYRVLDYEGKIHVEVPNFEKIIQGWLNAEDKTGFAMDTIFGLQTREGEEHKFGFTHEILKKCLEDVGFIDVFTNDIYSHGQDCIEAIGYKRKIEYNDDIFVIDCYPNTEEKMSILKNTIKKTKELNKPIALIGHYPLPEDVIKEVDYFIYDKNNPLSENYGLTFWMVKPQKVKVITSLTKSYHGLCCLTSIKNAATFLKDKFNFIHFIEYDLDADLNTFIENTNTFRLKGKKFIGFDYHYVVPKQDGLITNIFSFDSKWFDEKMVSLNKWSEYEKEASVVAKRINTNPDMILEHWMWNYFKDRDMLKDTHILSKEDKEKIIIKGNIKDQMDEEPEMHFRLSETNDNKIVLFIMRDDRVGSVGEYLVDYNGEVFKNIIEHGDIHHMIFEKEGIIKVSSGTYTNEFVISKSKIYKDTVFKFYNDKIKCIEWKDEWNEDFIPTENKIEYSFIEGAKVEIKGADRKKYKIDFINNDTGLSVYKTTVDNNCWSSPSPTYYINWKIKVNEEEYDFNVDGKNVLIHLDSKALGDTLAWVPYIDEFRKNHNCTVLGRTYYNDLFRNVYPEIKWVDSLSNPNDIYALYNVGCRDNDYNCNKNNWRMVPLQQVATDYLGLDYKEIRPKVEKSKADRPIKNKYVAISEFSTFQCKFWLYPNGWQKIIDYLKTKGYETMVISKEKTNLKRIIDRTNKPLEKSINNIQHADLFIGVSSGPSWLAWALDVPVVLISGYSTKWAEFLDNCARIMPPDGKCMGCFNEKDLPFDRGNWLWCPKSKNFECSRSITPEMVIEGINRLLCLEN